VPNFADSDGMSHTETYQNAGKGHILGICTTVPLRVG